jgi:hypothetical protein
MRARVCSVEVMTLVSGRRTRNPNLTSYLEYVLDLPKKTKTPLHEALCRQWLRLIKEQVDHPTCTAVRFMCGVCGVCGGECVPCYSSLTSVALCFMRSSTLCCQRWRASPGSCSKPSSSPCS